MMNVNMVAGDVVLGVVRSTAEADQKVQGSTGSPSHNYKISPLRGENHRGWLECVGSRLIGRTLVEGEVDHARISSA